MLMEESSAKLSLSLSLHRWIVFFFFFPLPSRFYRTAERSPIMGGDYYLIPPVERGRRVEQPAYGSDTATETR